MCIVYITCINRDIYVACPCMYFFRVYYISISISCHICVLCPCLCFIVGYSFHIYGYTGHMLDMFLVTMLFTLSIKVINGLHIADSILIDIFTVTASLSDLNNIQIQVISIIFEFWLSSMKLSRY